MRRDVPYPRLRQIVNQRQPDAAIGVQGPVRERGDHGHERHAIHVIGDRFGSVDPPHHPPGPFRRLEGAREGEKVDGGGRVGF